MKLIRNSFNTEALYETDELDLIRFFAMNKLSLKLGKKNC